MTLTGRKKQSRDDIYGFPRSNELCLVYVSGDINCKLTQQHAHLGVEPESCDTAHRENHLRSRAVPNCCTH